MAKVVVLYKNPKSAEAFDKHYSSVHIPPAKKIPDLKKYDITMGAVGAPTGPSGIHLWPRSILTRLTRLKPAWRRPKARQRLGILPTLRMAARSFTFSIRKKSETARRALGQS